jgi:hypothetical protein
MNSFTVHVRAIGQRLSYTAIGTDSVAVHMAAIDRFGACAITVTPRKERK